MRKQTHDFHEGRGTFAASQPGDSHLPDVSPGFFRCAQRRWESSGVPSSCRPQPSRTRAPPLGSLLILITSVRPGIQSQAQWPGLQHLQFGETQPRWRSQNRTKRSRPIWCGRQAGPLRRTLAKKDRSVCIDASL